MIWVNKSRGACSALWASTALLASLACSSGAENSADGASPGAGTDGDGEAEPGTIVPGASMSGSSASGGGTTNEPPSVITPPATLDPNAIVEADEPAPSAADCARDTYEAERVNTNVYLLLDISGSMLNIVSVNSEVTLWQAVRDAVKGFITAPQSSGLSLAMNYYPIQEPRTECDRIGRCANGTDCYAKVCDIRFALLDQLAACGVDDDCTLLYTDVDGTTYRESCIEPGHCSDEPLEPCFLDLQCNPGETCVAEATAICAGASSCEVPEYAAPDVELAALPDSADGFISSLDAHEPDRFALTPTQVALAGAYNQVQEWVLAEPDSQPVVILATDGEPNGCSESTDPDAAPGAFESAATIAAIEGAHDAGITTFVIGVVPDPTGLDAPPEAIAELEAAFAALADKLDQMAAAGGSEAAFNISSGDDTTEGFLDALDAIRGAVLPCDYEIPKPANGGAVAFDRLNVELSAADADVGETIPQVQAVSECVAGESAWYYKRDPDTEEPTRVQLCPSACEAANAAVGSRIDIVLGCQTVVRVR